jgi:ubiquinone/menaquinone biosynthesis C-methylase UbiE
MGEQSKTEIEQELTRIKDEYRRRDGAWIHADRYSLFNAAALLHAQSLERHLLALLKQRNVTTLAGKKILDVGCGNGGFLRRCIEYGAQPANLSGIDLLVHRLESARQLNPAIDWRIGSAHQLPYPDASFDLVTSFVVFSSILSEPARQRIADEMWRVRKPGGLILCYDFSYSNPRNPAVRGISRQDIRRLFQRPEAIFVFRRIALAPPIARLVAPRSRWLADTLEQFKILNTHILSIIGLSEDRS